MSHSQVCQKRIQ
uniref:Uncharacterized protein n=1 Tax=Anguilla anguilla TaxID=7936 RepID=A0A0E9UA96_ANGAN